MRMYPCKPRLRLPRRIASASQLRFYVLISIYYRNHEERSDVVISCKYWHLCRPVPGLLHPLARVRKFESGVFPVRAAVAKGGRTEIHPPFFPLECVYTGILFFTAAAFVFCCFRIPRRTGCKVAIAYASTVAQKCAARTILAFSVNTLLTRRTIRSLHAFRRVLLYIVRSFAAAAVGAFDFGIAVPACCKVAKTHAFAAVHKRTRRTAAAPVAVRR